LGTLEPVFYSEGLYRVYLRQRPAVAVTAKVLVWGQAAPVFTHARTVKLNCRG
jgi:hypothetical protein